MTMRQVSNYAKRINHLKIVRVHKKVPSLGFPGTDLALEELGVVEDDRSRSHLSVSDPNSFHRAVSSTLVIAQLFGLMPVTGIKGPQAANLGFRWWSARVLLSSMLLVLTGFWLGFWIYTVSASGSPNDEFVAAIFYGMTVANLILFYRLGMKWPALMLKIHHTELSMKDNYGYPTHLSRKLLVITAIILTVALAEHSFSIANDLRYSYLCADNMLGRMRTYFLGRHYKVFKVFSYSPLVGISLFLLDTHSTFVWNYMDLFVMAISIMLKERMKQINQRLCSTKHKAQRVSFWRGIREDFTKLTLMAYLIDDHINVIVLLSFGNNLFFICLQLYRSIQPHDNGLEASAYVYFSFGYLLIRSAAVCICAADIHEESKKPIKLMCCVPPDSYCEEVERFMEHVHSAEVALTGCKFFSITRRLLLTVVGTIVTYEVVMVQLTGVPEAIAEASRKNETSDNIALRQNPLCREKLLY